MQFAMITERENNELIIIVLIMRDKNYQLFQNVDQKLARYKTVVESG